MSELPPEAEAILGRARASGEVPELGEVVATESAVAPVEAATGNGAAPSSLIQSLRDQHKRIAARTHTIIPLALWQGKLAVRYHYLDERAFGRVLSLAGNVGDDPVAGTEANADLLIGGCDEVLACTDGDGEWRPLIDGEHLRFDARLAEALQLNVADQSARSVVYALFFGRTRGALAINAHATRYIEWLRGEAPGVASELQGESPAQS